MGRGSGWTTRPVLRLSLAGDVVQAETATEGWLPDRSASGEASDVARSFGFGSITLPTVFEPELLFGVLPDGTVVHSDSSAYHLKLTPPDASRVERVITRPISPRPVTPAVQEAYRKQRDAEWEARLRRAEQAGMRLTVLGSPEPRYYPELPVIQALSATLSKPLAWRSIPAHAGEPRPLRNWTPPRWVYPRPRGGAGGPDPPNAARSGLSPPTRGSHTQFRREHPVLGSIPAHAGEPRIRTWSRG